MITTSALGVELFTNALLIDPVLRRNMRYVDADVAVFDTD